MHKYLKMYITHSQFTLISKLVNENLYECKALHIRLRSPLNLYCLSKFKMLNIPFGPKY